MKKLSIYLAALASLALVSCDEDFFMPGTQTNAQESVLKVSDVTVTPLMTTAVDLNTLINEQGEDVKAIPFGVVSVKEGAISENVTLQATVEVSANEDFSNAMVFDANEMEKDGTISLSPSKLQEAYYNNVTHSPKTKNMYVRSYVKTVTDGISVAIVGAPEYFTKGTMAVTPVDQHIVIEDAYYYLGSNATDQTYKFTNSGADPYDDPVFTCTVPVADGWHWFKIAPASAYDASGNMDWGKEESCICPIVGDDTELSGKCKNGKNSWHLLQDDGISAFQITVNVMDMTYSITPVSAVPKYYIVGRQNNWQMSTVSALYPVNGSTVSYTSYFTNAWDCRIATPANAIAGIWDHDFGAASNGCTDANGTLVADCSNCIASPGVGYYTLTANFSDMTYSWTKIEGTPATYGKIGLVGGNDDWNNDIFLTKVEGSGDLGGADTHNWYAHDVKIDFCSWGVKFRVDAGWDISFGSGDNGFPFGVADGGDNITVEPGVYDVYFNDITKQYFFVKK